MSETALQRDADRSAALSDRLLGTFQGALQRLETVCEYVNPILVKETRQALKSRQFVVTLLVVLVACWAASFAVVAIIGPDVYYVASGTQMLYVYTIILAVPLILIVPFSAFRSLSAEQEDNTYELLSITTLTPQQIITGKLGSAAVQMLVYMSAVSPCIAFTYLLRGVDTPTISFLLIYFMLLSMGLSMLGLLAGTNSKTKHSQVLISVLLVMCLGLTLIGVISFLGEFVPRSSVDIADPWFWTGNFAFLSFYAAIFALLHAAAAAQISFTSDNRSTPLRKRIILLLACFIGWVSVLPAAESNARDIWLVAILLTGIGSVIFLYAMGSLLTSEWPHLSRRVQRSLPRTALGRVCLTWFNPGPNTGYMFTISTLMAVNLVGAVLALIVPPVRGGFPTPNAVSWFCLLSWCYVVIFLGIGKLLVSVVRTVTFVQLSAGFLLHLLLFLLACGVPQVIYLMTPSLRMGEQFSLLQITNPVWTLSALLENGPAAVEAPILLGILGPVAGMVLLANVRAAATAVGYFPRGLPDRILQEEAALHLPSEIRPRNPWDDPSGEAALESANPDSRVPES